MFDKWNVTGIDMGNTKDGAWGQAGHRGVVETTAPTIIESM